MHGSEVRPLRRLLLYSHDTYGLGHLRRNLAIATHMLHTIDQLQVVLMSGSPVASRFPIPRGLSLVSLPPVVKVAAEQYVSRGGRVGFGVVSRARAAIMLDVALRFQPDALLVDHAPHGMKGELLPTFAALQHHLPETRIVLGLRDVLDAPDVVRNTWLAEGVVDTLEHVYHRLLVYGCQEILDVATAYGIPTKLRSRISYCGYVSRAAATASPTAHGEAALPGGPFVLGTAGGGEDGAQVLRATIRAAHSLGAESVVVTGPLMPSPMRAELAAEAATVGRARVIEFVTDLQSVMSRAAAIVTMGGYNTLCEAAASAVPTVVVPRLWPRREQAIRAALFAERGLVRVVEPGAALADRLTVPLAAALAQKGRGVSPIDLHGAERVRRALVDEVARAWAAPAAVVPEPLGFASA